MNPPSRQAGALYGLGLGPGDPELVTRKAWRIIQSARVVVYSAPEGGDSLARRIAADAIDPSAEEIRIDAPMPADQGLTQEIFDAAAGVVAARLASGRDVAALCEGDPLFDGSFRYLFERLADRFRVQTIPGVSSMTACAAALGWPLAGRDAVLIVAPGTLAPEAIAARIQSTEVVVIVKIGRRLPELRALIDDLGLLDQSGYVEVGAAPGGDAMRLVDAPDDAADVSVILIDKRADAWTPPAVASFP